MDGPVGLANRRLSILDPTPAGHMPMFSADGNLVITYNGEVYNFKDLARDLEGLGYTMRSGTDTEVILHAFDAWGPAAIERFNGMFALAIWDREERTLFLARDRYGIKPLYYCEAGPLFIFGSEIKSLLRHDAVHAELSAPHLLEYFTFQNIFTDGTLFRDVKLLRAGHHVTISAGSVSARIRSSTGTSTSANRTAARATRSTWRSSTACSPRPSSDSSSPTCRSGAHLSGGMDSGSITALAARSLPYLNTFTVGFDMTSSLGLELGNDERTKAEAMSYRFQTEHYEAVLKAGDMERCMPELMWHLEDPRVGQSYPNYYVARLASKFVKVVLGGSGGDELFAGYPWRYYRAVVNDDFDHYVEKYYRFWHRLTAEPGTAGILPRERVERNR